MKKVICLLLTFIIIISMITVSASVPKEEVPKLLKTLNLLGYTSPEGDSIVTRGQFAMLVAKLINYGDYEGYTTDPIFIDVPVNHEAYGAINLLRELNIVNGVSESTFSPDEPILWEHALKMIIYVMGYEHLLTNDEYLIVGSKLKLLRNIEFNDDRTMTYSTALMLIQNVLEADVSGYNRIDGYTNANNEATFMSRRLGIDVIRGEVTDDGKNSILGESEIRPDQIKIGEYVFENKTELSNLLGYYVEGYYTYSKNTGKYNLLFVYIDMDETELVTIDAKNIVKYSGYVYEYYEDDEATHKSKLMVDRDYKLIYNGRLYLADTADTDFNLTTEQMMIPDTGSVKLSDTDGNGRYDIVSVKNYKNFVINSVDRDNYVIYGKAPETPGSISLLSAEDDITILSHTGEEIDWLGLRQGEVVSVAKSADGKRAEIIISVDKVKGFISSKNELGYKINDTLYEFAPEFEAYSKTSPSFVPDSGDNAELYIGFDGRVVYARIIGTDNTMYACMIALAKEGVFNETIKVKLYTQDNSLGVYDLSDKAMIDGCRYKSADSIIQHLSPFTVDGENGETYKGIVLIKLNKDNEVIYIDTPYTKTYGNPYGGSEDANTLHVMTGGERYVTYRHRNSHVWGGRFLSSLDTVHICMGTNAQNPEDDIMFTGVIDTNVLYDSNNYVDVIAFATNTDALAAEAVVNIMPRTWTGSSAERTSFGYMVVLSISQALNADGDIIDKITVTNGKQIKEYETESDRTITCNCGSQRCTENPIVVEAGDIVSFGVNKDGIILDGEIAVIYDKSEDKQWFYTDRNADYKHNEQDGSQGIYALGSVMLLNGYMNRIQNENSEWVIDFWPLKSAITWQGENLYSTETVSDRTNVKKMLQLTEAYVIEVDVKKGNMTLLTTGDIAAYNDGSSGMKKYKILMKEYLPYCIITYKE